MKKFLPILICFALLLSISFSGSVFAATVNEAEPNNTFANANGITPGNTMNGKISSTSDVDYYKLSIMYSGNRSITLSNIPSGCNYNLYFYDYNGNTLNSSTASGNTDENISINLIPGAYYIGVKSSSGYSSSDYTLSVKSIGSTTTPTLPYHGGDAYEYNDTLELASSFYGSVEANIHPLGDFDYYKFTVTQTTTKHIVLYNPYNGPSYHFNIYNANGGYVNSDGGIGDCTVTLTPGTYYIKVFGYDSESVLNYRLVMTTI
ncbi:MAG: peptidase domain protein [Eubacterium sp.]|jgi:hypothetical protein|nr:peptidase domain protein [Eubacterium sp.]